MIKLKPGNLLMWAGTILVLASLALLLYNNNQDTQAGAQAAALLARVEQQTTHTDAAPAPTDQMTTVDVDGEAFVGTVELPTQNLTLPVLSEWSEEQAKTAPCRYLGSAQDGDLIVAGHNYRTHFGRLSNLRDGDPVTFTDVNGTVYAYVVVGTEVIDQYDTAAMEAGDWDLTLFTCTMDGSKRITVRCAGVA